MKSHIQEMTLVNRIISIGYRLFQFLQFCLARSVRCRNSASEIQRTPHWRTVENHFHMLYEFKVGCLLQPRYAGISSVDEQTFFKSIFMIS